MYISLCYTGAGKVYLATHVLQLVYLAVGGFRFPFAYFATREAQAPELHYIMWEAIDRLMREGFEVQNVCSFIDAT